MTRRVTLMSLLSLVLGVGVLAAPVSIAAGGRTDAPRGVIAATAAMDTSSPVGAWRSTSNGRKRLRAVPSRRGRLILTSRWWRPSDRVQIAVDATRPAQEFRGAGASLTESSAALIGTLDPAAQEALLADLFAPEGLGLTYLRQPLSSTDFGATNDFRTFQDTPGVFDYSSQSATVLPLLHRILAINPAVRVMGTPWTAPAWMKTNGSLLGGSLAEQYVEDYADHLTRVLVDLEAAGVGLDELTVQNEPGLETDYPSMRLSSSQQQALVRAVDARLTAAGLDTRLWVGDHNWSDARTVLQTLQGLGDVERVAGGAFHCYSGSPEDTQRIVDAGWRVATTECTGRDSYNTSLTRQHTLMWQVENLIVRAFRSGSETLILWNLALDERGGPHFGACGTRCNGVVEISSDGLVTPNADYDVLGHLSRYVDVGARVIASSATTNGVKNVAFLNPDGERVMVAINTASSSRTIEVTDGALRFKAKMPASSVETYTWRP